ncbi:MAG: UvrD-helicase domain-containing protein [Oscillospiraceae bacterium]
MTATEQTNRVSWTDEQRAAIEAQRVCTIVPAAAGSGKTAVLTERTMRMLADPAKKIPADTLLAVTFTNDAAAQMKKKIADAIAGKLADAPGDAWLTAQQNLLPNAKITTINAFCYELVRSHAEEFDFAGTVRILEDGRSRAMRREALDKTFEDWCARRAADTTRLTDAFFDKNEAALLDAADELSKFLRALAFPTQWVTAMKTRDAGAAGVDFFARMFLEKLADAANEMRSAFPVMIRYVKKLVLPEKINALLDADIELSDALAALCESRDYDAVQAFLDEVKWINTKRSITKTEQVKLTADTCQIEEQTLTYINAARDAYKAKIEALRKELKWDRAEIARGLATTWEIFALLLEFVEDAQALLLKTKNELGAVDFADVERMTL